MEKDKRGRPVPTLDKSFLARFERVVSYLADRACCLSREQIAEDLRFVRERLAALVATLFSESLRQAIGDLLRHAAVLMDEEGNHRDAEEARRWAGKYSQPKTLEQLVQGIAQEGDAD